MLHTEFQPPEELRDTIKCFWYNTRNCGEKQTSYEVVPDGYAEIIFHFGNGISILHDGNLQQLPSPFIMGLLNKPAIFYSQGRLDIIGIRCFPWTVFDLLGLPSGKDGLRTIDHPIARLQSSLKKFINDNKIDDAIAIVTKYFSDTRTQIANDSLLYKAGIAMLAANGTMQVNKVAAAAHATVRTLERKFRQSSGYSVKDVSGLMRFEQVRNTLWLHPDTNLAGLAQEFGYADQSHLSKEFKRYTGTTPAAFAKKAKKEKPFANNDFVAFVQA
jgi:AraC-like DNA-binding protein